MNWGKGIIIGMVAFMTFITVMGVYMFKNSPKDFDRQYYEKGLAYDSVYTKEKQVITDNAQPTVRVDRNTMHITFTKAANGTVRFERPSDPSLDRVLPFETDSSNELLIPMQKFALGEWHITLDWKSSGTKYLYQKEMFLP
jgi:hypothetical protein